MSKRAATAAMVVALGLGSQCQARAEQSVASGPELTSNSTNALLAQKSYPTGFSANQSQSQTQTWELNPKTGISTPAWTTKSTGTPAASETTPKAPATNGATPASPASAGKPSTTKKKEEPAVICTAAPIISKGARWQHFENWITLKTNQDQLAPLTLQVTNGGDNVATYTAVRLMLSGRPIATEKDFKNNVLSMSMVGALGVGQNQLVIDAFGPAGAKLSWKVTTPQPSLSSADPTTTSPGKELTLAGKNFSPNASINVVSFGNTTAKLKSASAKQIVAIVPEGVAGEQTITVSVAGLSTKSVKVKIQPTPEVTGCDMVSAPPGNALTITGKNFSTKPGENQVLINGVPASITSQSATSISITIPEMETPVWNCPIQVLTNKIPSKGNVTINLQRRVIPNEGVPES